MSKGVTTEYWISRANPVRKPSKAVTINYLFYSLPKEADGLEETMSKLFYNIKLTEVQTTQDGDYLKEYTNNLPHAREIAECLTKSWNAMDWSEIFDGIFKDQVKISRMRPLRTRDDGVCIVQITTTFNDGFRLTEKRRNAFWEQMEAQMCDRWGEGVFGPVNILEFADGTFGYPE